MARSAYFPGGEPAGEAFANECQDNSSANDWVAYTLLRKLVGRA